ncbi:MAG: hypothetical protein R3E89_16710 [Thiolinea sp.]
MAEKMVEGRMRKFLAEITLVGQPFVKNPDQTVAQLLKEKGATVLGFHPYGSRQKASRRSRKTLRMKWRLRLRLPRADSFQYCAS